MWVINNQLSLLAVSETEALSNELFDNRKNILKHYVELTTRVISYLETTPSSEDNHTKEEILNIIRSLRFADDGYFYVYDGEGNNLAHPVIPALEGKNLIELRDSEGNLVIRNLLAAAQFGDGYYKYTWQKPSTSEVVPKLGYAVWLPDKKWMLGTGLYIEDIDQQVAKVESVIDSSIQRIFSMFVFVLVTVIIVIILIALAVNLHEHYESDCRLRELTYKNVILQEESSKRLSRELHDGVNQLLVSAKCHLEIIKTSLDKNQPLPILNHIVKSEHSLTKAINEVRTISRRLRPSALDDIGLNAAIESLLDDFFADGAMRVLLFLDQKLPCLPCDFGTSLYRTVQESLVNVKKHANSHKVEVTLKYIQPCVHLSIRDEGTGFSVEQALAGEGIGLRNMRERIEYIGGEFHIWSQPNRGTEITAVVKIPETALKMGND
ncbi:cache domain-containing protein [Veronia pacifica]|nr:cache domain-containing protein [Veronia pacifica]